MQKKTVSSFSQGLYLQVLWISLRYTSKLMIHGFFNFVCVSEGGPPESGVRKGKNIKFNIHARVMVIQDKQICHL
jgi:hypothetical protein